MTNEMVVAATHAMQTAAQVVPAAPSHGFDLTYFSSVVAVCLSIIAMFFRYSNDRNKMQEDKVAAQTGANESTSKQIQTLENGLKETSKAQNELEKTYNKEHQDLKDVVARNSASVQVMQEQVANSVRNIDELKRDNKEMLKKVDDLIKTFFEYLNK